jgi:outer membrane protein assembly factor BamD (BamD/ComL family)
MTKDFQKRVILSLGFFLLLFLSSCGWLRKEQVQKEQGQKEQTQKQTDDVYEQAQIELEAGKFQKAIDLCKEIYQKYPQDPTVRSDYIKTLESIKSSGDGAFERNDFKLAGNIYEILVRNWVHFSDFSQSLSFKKNFLENKTKTSRCLFTEEQVSSHLKAGEFRKAIDICKEIYQKYPQDPTVRSGYIKTLESIKSSGDGAFKKSDFALAGCVYGLLLKNYSSVGGLNGSLSFNREGLTLRIGDCKKILFEKGLEKYRSGNLNQAISLWKSILVFDPENQEIKKAVDMASLQSKNLQKAK